MGRRGALRLTSGLAAWLAAPPLLGATAAVTVALPAPRLTGPLALETALQRRRSLRRFAPASLDLADAGQLLWAAQGLSDGAGHRTAPSAGALYPLTLVLVAGRVDGLAPGLYRYAPQPHRLARFATGDRRPALAAAALGQSWLQQAPALVAIVADPARTAQRYGALADRFVAIEAGAAAQNLLLQAVALGLGSTLVAAFDAAATTHELALPAGEQLLALVAVGQAA